MKKFKALSSLEVIELMMKDEELVHMHHLTAFFLACEFISLLLQTVTEEDSTFVSGLEDWVVPYLERLEASTAGGSRGLLKQYLTRLSKVCVHII